MTLPIVFLLALPMVAAAQDGLSAPWQLKQKLESMTAYCKRLSPVLEQLRPADWRDAPPGYVEQHQTVRSQVQSLQLLAAKLQKEPERLPMILDLFFRYDTFDLMLSSLIDGVRRYQNPALADLITGMRTENAGVRQSLKDYMIELANAKDQEFRIADQEAQRCRNGILKQPVRR